MTLPILPAILLTALSVHLSEVGYSSLDHTIIHCHAADMANLPTTLNTVTYVALSTNKTDNISTTNPYA